MAMPVESPAGWAQVRLGEVAEVLSGVAKNTKRHLTDPVEVPYLRVANVQDGFLDLSEIKTIRLERSEVERFTLRDGDVLMNEGGDIDKLGRGAVWKAEVAPCVHQNHVFSVRCGSRLLPYHLSAVAESPIGKSYFLEVGKQTTNLASINKTLLRDLPIPLPPLPEQKKIAAILSSVDEAIQATQGVIDQTRRVKEGLLQDLLTRGIGHTRFKESPIGEIPEGWEVRQLGEVTESRDSQRIPLKAADRQQRQGEYRYYGASGVIDYVDGFIFDGLNLLVAEDGFNLLRRATPIAFVVDGQYWVNNHAHVLGPTGVVDLHFLAAYFARLDIRPYLTGFEMPKLNAKALGSVKVPVPPMAEQEQIAARLHAVDGTVRTATASVAELQQVKAGLLQDLLTGQVRVAA